MIRTAFRGKTVVVTGGASGIGRALAAELVGFGAHVTIADINRVNVEQAAESLERMVRDEGSISPVVVDVRDGPTLAAAVDDVVATRGGIDFMFNNAGISIGGLTHEMPAAYFDRTIDINLRGVVNGVIAAYPHMVRQRRGHIVNTASMAGLVGAPMTAAYSMTKHAVVGLTTTLRPEARVHGVRVSVLCPGAIDTPILDSPPPSDLPPLPSPALTGREFLALFGISPVPADRFAGRALDAVARNRSIIIGSAPNRALWYAHRLSPSLMETIAYRMARRVMKRLEGTFR